MPTFKKNKGFNLKNKGNFDFGNNNFNFNKKNDYSKKYKDEGITYTSGSNEEQDVIRKQWGDSVDAPVRDEDKK